MVIIVQPDPGQHPLESANIDRVNFQRGRKVKVKDMPGHTPKEKKKRKKRKKKSRKK